MKKKLISITKNHISKGSSLRAGFCPIALALKEKFKTYNVSVYNTRTMINHKTILLPLKAVEFIRRFDLWLKVKPFSFKINDIS